MEPADSGAICTGGEPTGPAGTDPYSIYRRGVWFDGVQQYITMAGYVLNHTFTIDIWANIYANSALFSVSKLIQGDDDHFLIGIETSTRLSANYFPSSYSLIDVNSSFTQ
jgi:hypothetical protein